MFLLVTLVIKAQKITASYIYRGNIYLRYDNKDSIQLTNKGLDTEVLLSKKKDFIVFLRVIEDSIDTEYGIDKTSIIRYDLPTSTEKSLVEGVEIDGSGGTKISYSETPQYPFLGLHTIFGLKISTDEKRIYFQTQAWTVEDALHCYEINTGKVLFIGAGDLNYIFDNGNLSITMSRIKKNQGRHWYEWLCDKNGRKIKLLGEVTY